MAPIPPALREALDARRRIRAADHGYCGKDCDAREAMETWKRLARFTVAHLRALRERERAGLLGGGAPLAE